MQWMTSFHPRLANAQPIAAVAPSVAYPLPQTGGSSAQPISFPIAPSGTQGPIRPIHAPELFSITENSPQPLSLHIPAVAAMPSQASIRFRIPPINFVDCSLASSDAHGSKSLSIGGLINRRSVSISGFTVYPTPYHSRAIMLGWPAPPVKYVWLMLLIAASIGFFNRDKSVSLIKLASRSVSLERP